MVVDTSAVLAVLLAEPDGAVFLTHLNRTPQPLLSAANWLELGIVIEGRKGPQWLVALDAFSRRPGYCRCSGELEPRAYRPRRLRRLGKGTIPPA